MGPGFPVGRRTVLGLAPSGAMCGLLPRWPAAPLSGGADAGLTLLYREYYRLCEAHMEAVALSDAARFSGVVSAARRTALETEARRAGQAVDTVLERFWATPAETLPDLALKFRLLFRTEWYDGSWPETGVIDRGSIDRPIQAEVEAALMDLERLAARHTGRETGGREPPVHDGG